VVEALYRRPRRRNHTMTRPVDLSAATTAALRLEARYEIGGGFDYSVVRASADGGTTWTSLDGTCMRIRVSPS
jgi:immune inhibitor A